jgi:hypothetical protein
MINWLTVFYYFLIALAISTIWCIAGRKEYSYNQKFAKIFGISAFPLIGWTLGLAVAMILSDLINSWLYLSNIYSQFGAFLLMYWTLLLAAETIGYHVFNVKNKAAAKYKGIPILDCMHAVWWMKIVYFSLGPVMFIVSKLIFSLIGAL